MKIGRSISTAIATHAGLTITHGAVTDLIDTTDLGVHAALNTGVHGVGASYVALAASAGMQAVNRASDDNFGRSLRRGVNNDWINIAGAPFFGAGIYLYGPTAAGTPGRISAHVPNAALNADITAFEFSGATDTPEMIAGTIPGARLKANDHGAAAHTNRVRPLPLIPFTDGTGTRGSVGKFGVYVLDAAGEFANANFRIPVGFVSFSNAQVEIVPLNTGTFDWTAEAEEVAAGEAIGTDTDSDTADNEAGTSGQLLRLGITTALNGLTLAVGDLVGVKFILDALNTITQIRLVGLSITLTMDE